MEHGRVLRGLFFLLCAMACRNGLAVEEAGSRSSAFNYKDALGKAILFFEGQRSGNLPASQRVKWREDSALADGKDEKVNLIGGYYDAGDNVKFGWPMAFTVSLLSWAAIEYEKEISSVNQLGNLRTAIRWGTNFILKVGDGNSGHQCWERPEDMDTRRTLYKINSSSPGTEAAAEAAAALSAASIVFRRVDAKYSRRLLSHSRSLFEFANKYRGSYQGSCPFYCSYSGYQDELLWAAAWLYKESGENKYSSYLSSNQGSSQLVSEFSWDNKFVGAQTLLAKEFYSGNKDFTRFKSDAESFICAVMPGSSSVQIRTTPEGLLFVRESSNLQYATSSSMVLFIYSRTLEAAHIEGVNCGSVHFSASELRKFAKSQLDYILGKNHRKMSYMVGFGNKYPKQLHHRGSSIPSLKVHPQKVGCGEGFSTYFCSSKPNPNTHLGAIVGGPDSNDNYNDVRSDSPHAEPTTYMNAAFVGSVAALLGESKEEYLQYPPTDMKANMTAYV